MRHLHHRARVAQAACNLEMATGIGRGHEARGRRLQMADLALEKRLRLRWLRQRVDAGAAAAPVRFGELD